MSKAAENCVVAKIIAQSATAVVRGVSRVGTKTYATIAPLKNNPFYIRGFTFYGGTRIRMRTSVDAPVTMEWSFIMRSKCIWISDKKQRYIYDT